MSKLGFVSFVGAGPGDLGLVTQNCIDRLQKADVILYDRLANPRLLRFAKESAHFVYCGKLPDRHTLRQEKINDLLVEFASKGAYVVRLKGGDPSVFGRVGEEAECVAKHSIPFEIIPAVTSSIAAAAYAGIPVTHRNYSNSFTIRTGHVSNQNTVYDPSSQELGDTVAYYMGVKNLATNCKQLIEEGKDPETPVAVIEWATLGKQRVVIGTLTTISEAVHKAHIQNPAMTIVGEVVDLRSKLAWFERKPFFNKKILIVDSTANLALEEYFTSIGAESYTIPRFKQKEMQLTKQMFDELNHKDEVIFTNPDSVKIFWKQFMANGYSVWDLPRSIGYLCEKTHKILADKGIQATKGCRDRKMAAMIKCRGNVAKGLNEFETHEWILDERFNEINDRVVKENVWETVIFTSNTSVDIYMEQLKKVGAEHMKTPSYAYMDKSVECYAREMGFTMKNEEIQLELLNWRKGEK
ncbi:MAG: uroporphyrinogen-III C-methyltransferase [Bacillaceae bacterium]|nr:uroporphyrinogen-III C-methyltransferase [Bacillaceae bacterium]